MDDIDTSVGYFIGLLIVWILCGYLGYRAGAARGRGDAGFWLGFLLGPLGCIIALFLPANPSAAPSAAHVQRQTYARNKRCSLCGRLADLRAKTCPDCGGAL